MGDDVKGFPLATRALAAVIRERPRRVKVSRLTPAALADLETALSAGQIATLKNAQTHLVERHGIVYGSLDGVSQQLGKHRIELKTGRRRHEYSDAGAQDAFKTGFRGAGGREAGCAGMVLR
jgi:hypothetical protein